MYRLGSETVRDYIKKEVGCKNLWGIKKERNFLHERKRADDSGKEKTAKTKKTKLS